MKKILVVVDMQNDFITGSLGTKEAVKIVPAVVSKIKAYQAEGAMIIYTRDTHFENYLETAEGKKLPVTHCIKDTWGWEIEDQIKALVGENDLVIDKPTFGSVALGEQIHQMTQKEDISIELVGLCTDICVISNALLIKAYEPEIQIQVAKSCCAGVSPESHEQALGAMTMCQIDVIN